MADDNGGTFGGDGSVRWEIVSGDEIKTSDSSPEPAASKYRILRRNGPNGTRCVGLDNRIGKEFVISVRPPTGVSAKDFIARFQVKGGRVLIRLPIEKVGKQIKVRWGRKPTGV
jgi:hypothetical protein